jgi:hypothetical protein
MNAKKHPQQKTGKAGSFCVFGKRCMLVTWHSCSCYVYQYGYIDLSKSILILNAYAIFRVAEVSLVAILSDFAVFTCKPLVWPWLYIRRPLLVAKSTLLMLILSCYLEEIYYGVALETLCVGSEKLGDNNMYPAFGSVTKYVPSYTKVNIVIRQRANRGMRAKRFCFFISLRTWGWSVNVLNDMRHAAGKGTFGHFLCHFSCYYV